MKAAALVLAAAAALAADKPVTMPEVMRKVEALDASLRSLAADYTQFVKWDASGTTQAIEGSVEFKKPNKLRLEQRTPEPQTVVADGTWLWIYRKSTNQVIKARFEDWKRNEPLAQGLVGLGDYAGLLRSYDVALSTASGVKLLLTPRGKKKDFSLTLTLSATDYFPLESELKAGGVSVHSIFKNIRYNPAMADERFRFSPPPGADVFENK